MEDYSRLAETLRSRRSSAIQRVTATFGAAISKVAFASIVTIAGIVILGLVLISPLALTKLGSLYSLDWLKLSNIGQTYDVASALLTGLALTGVTSSLIFQVREVQASREESSREHHAHLVEMALQDQVYQRCWGDNPSAYPTQDAYRQHSYVNLIVSYWEREFVLGNFSRSAVRDLLTLLFRGEVGRSFWADVHEFRSRNARNRKERHFCKIASEEYSKAIAGGPPIVSAAGVPPAGNFAKGYRSHWKHFFAAGTTGAMLALTGRAILRRTIWQRDQ
jgi:hypothetical protein